MLFNIDNWQNFTLEEVNLEKQKKAKEIFIKDLKTGNQKLTLILD